MYMYRYIWFVVSTDVKGLAPPGTAENNVGFSKYPDQHKDKLVKTFDEMSLKGVYNCGNNPIEANERYILLGRP